MCKEDVQYRTDDEFLVCQDCTIRYHKGSVGEKGACGKCQGGLEAVKGEVLICASCNRWYPVIDDIPRMLPDELREDLE
jgi:uncharacterized protein YbaR (Trm112 family)